MSALFMTSLLQTAGQKMSALTVLFREIQRWICIEQTGPENGGEKLLCVGYILDSISVGKAHDTTSVPFTVNMTAFVAHGRSVHLCHLIQRTRRLANHITESGGRS